MACISVAARTTLVNDLAVIDARQSDGDPDTHADAAGTALPAVGMTPCRNTQQHTQQHTQNWAARSGSGSAAQRGSAVAEAAEAGGAAMLQRRNLAQLEDVPRACRTLHHICESRDGAGVREVCWAYAATQAASPAGTGVGEARRSREGE
jgi:hypothetical protein